MGTLTRVLSLNTASSVKYKGLEQDKTRGQAVKETVVVDESCGTSFTGGANANDNEHCVPTCLVAAGVHVHDQPPRASGPDTIQVSARRGSWTIQIRSIPADITVADVTEIIHTWV